MTNVGLFIPCYIDQFYPNVAVATLTLLERLGCSVDYPMQQTCCGQPLANAGFSGQATGTMRHFVDVFGQYDYVVAPSGSCVLHVREHYEALGAEEGPPPPAAAHLRARTYELCEFLVDVLQVERLDVAFAHRVGLHESCHGLRGLRLGPASEVQASTPDKVRRLLAMVDGLELVPLDRADECCGFGGTFAVTEVAVSARMGQDRLADHRRHGAEVITGTDMSCLMHLEGLARRGVDPPRFLHIAEILCGGRHA